MPLSIEGLCEAVSITEGSDIFNVEDVVDENDILHWCSSLVRRHSSGRYLEFVHYSVEEFLRDAYPGDPVFDSYSTSPEKVRSLVGQLSLRYLTFRNHEAEFGPIGREIRDICADGTGRALEAISLVIQGPESSSSAHNRQAIVRKPILLYALQ